MQDRCFLIHQLFLRVFTVFCSLQTLTSALKTAIHAIQMRNVSTLQVPMPASVEVDAQEMATIARVFMCNILCNILTIKNNFCHIEN